MRILIALTDAVGKNIAFITDDLVVRTLEEVVTLVREKLIEGVHIVSTENGPYVRTNRNNTETDNLNFLSISIVEFSNELKSGAKSDATKFYGDLLDKKLKDQPEVIYINGKMRATKEEVVNRLKPLSQEIRDAAKKYHIDPNTLGAILIDEYVRAGLDDLLDIVGRFGGDTSVGLAQIKMDTARNMIVKGHYKDASKDISNKDLYNLLADDKTSIHFAAAVIKMHIDQWKAFIDLRDRPEILGTLYSLGEKTPHGNPKESDRGKQIKNEFYLLISEILND